MSTKLREKAGKGVMVLLVTVSLFFVSIGSASAGRHDLGGGWQKGDMKRQHHNRSVLGIWRNANAVQKLGLTDDQVAQLKDSDFAAREKQLELKSQLEGYRLEMEKAFSAESLDENAVRQLAGKIADTKGNLLVQRVESRLTVAKVLTADQMEKLKENAMRQKNKKHRGDRKCGQYQEKGNGQRQKASTAGDCIYNARN